jgi:hypothetical protein
VKQTRWGVELGTMRNLMGNPAFSLSDCGLANQFDILTPLAVGLLAGGMTRRLQGPRTTDRSIGHFPLGVPSERDELLR